MLETTGNNVSLQAGSSASRREASAGRGDSGATTRADGTSATLRWLGWLGWLASLGLIGAIGAAVIHVQLSFWEELKNERANRAAAEERQAKVMEGLMEKASQSYIATISSLTQANREQLASIHDLQEQVTELLRMEEHRKSNKSKKDKESEGRVRRSASESER
jgi:hypothetical protein